MTIDTNNYSAMAKAMGIAGEGSTTPKKSNNLNRLRIWHSLLWEWRKSMVRLKRQR